MRSDAKIELFTALNTLLSAGLNCDVFTEIGSYDSYPSWVVISQYNSAPLGTKTRFGSTTSFIIEIYTASDNVLGNANLVNDVLGLVHPSKVPSIEMANFTMYVLNEPTITGFTENNERGMVSRTQLRYTAQINQKDFINS
jgi:hypothetical protein